MKRKRTMLLQDILDVVNVADAVEEDEEVRVKSATSINIYCTRTTRRRWRTRSPRRWRNFHMVVVFVYDEHLRARRQSERPVRRRQTLPHRGRGGRDRAGVSHVRGDVGLRRRGVVGRGFANMRIEPFNTFTQDSYDKKFVAACPC